MNNLFRLMILCFLLIVSTGFSQESKQIKIGSLQSWYSSAGSEVEVGRRGLTSDQQDGLRWPALYENQDTEAFKALWIGTTNYNDPIAGRIFPHKVVHAGPRVLELNAEIMPVEFKMIGRFDNPQVFVNAQSASNLTLGDADVDEIDNSLVSDRMIYNEVNTSIGITIKRQVYAFTNQDHDNYYIYDYVFKNTGIYDRNGSTQNVTLNDVVFHWMYRYAVAREACAYGGSWLPQSATWGRNTMNDQTGHGVLPRAATNVVPHRPDSPLRTLFSWSGKHSAWDGAGTNMGAPEWNGDGHFGASQFVGTVVLYADDPNNIGTNSPDQPFSTEIIGSDDPNTRGNDQFNETKMTSEYTSVMDLGWPNLIHADAVGQGDADQWGSDPGGYSQTHTFGKYTMAFGDSIRIVIAEAVAGLNRDSCYSIGANWLNWVNGSTGPFTLPDGSTTNDGDLYKNEWVFTGVDSLFQAFNNALSNFNSGFNIPTPPPPPESVEVISDSLFIHLAWADNAINWSNFAGYEIYRSTNFVSPDFELIFSCGQGTPNPAIVHSYNDSSVISGSDYYYYIQTLDDGSTNNGIPLRSSKFWTLTNTPASLTNNPGVYADLYVSPGGDNNNSGLSWSEPLLTITDALQKIRAYSLQPRTIYVGSGIYSPSTNGEIFPLNGKSYVTISGSGAWYPILDAESSAGVFTAQGVENLKIENLTIQNGLSDYGAGIKCTSVSNLTLSNVKIRNNSANINGGGIYITSNSNLIFDNSNRCDIFSNSSGLIGDDIYATAECPVMGVFVDTFTVISPSDYYIYPSHKFTYDILNYKIAQENADLYVSPTGDDNNSGLTAGVPLRTITQAIKKINADAQNPHTINLEQGVYSQSQTGEPFPIYTKSYISLSGDNKINTILNGEQNSNLVYCYGDNNLSIENCSIVNGFTMHHGGGIYCKDATLSLNDVLISGDSSYTGAGIYCDSSVINLSGVTIKDNAALSSGGGIVFHNNSGAYFDPTNRSNIYNNLANSYGKDLYAATAGINVVLDTFTVMYPTDEYAFPVSNFTYDINNGLKYQVNGDVYVSPTGDDNNTGTSAQDPLRTINYALNVIYTTYNDPHTIYLADGVYSPSANGDSLPIIPKEYVTISGNSQVHTILDGEGQYRIFESEHLNDYTIKNLTIQNGFAEDGGGIYLFNSNPEISNVTFFYNKAIDDGGALYCENSTPAFSDVIFLADSAKDGGAIYLRESDARFERTIFAENQGKYGAVMYLYESQPEIINSTFTNNTASTRGGAIENRNNSSPLIVNSILWGDTPQEIHCFNTGLTVSHSDIEGGETGITGTTTTINWLSGNRDLDPLFVGGNPFDFNLTQNSPCIDKGTDLFVWQGDTIINLPDTSYFSSAPDMGALESPFVSSISPGTNLIPEQFALYQNYPNPFNPVTKIEYDLPEKSEVKLNIYNLLGKKVRTLINKPQLPGQKTAIWDALNDQGRKVASGLYFYKIIAGEYTKTNKMLLLK